MKSAYMHTVNAVVSNDENLVLPFASNMLLNLRMQLSPWVSHIVLSYAIPVSKKKCRRSLLVL